MREETQNGIRKTGGLLFGSRGSRVRITPPRPLLLSSFRYLEQANRDLVPRAAEARNRMGTRRPANPGHRQALPVQLQLSKLDHGRCLPPRELP
jgi:hypothetical protein